MTALYFSVLKPEDRVAVKPHASPVFHAIQYLFGHQTRDKLERFRGLGGAQSYPSRTKDADDVDFSTGSVGLGGRHDAVLLDRAGLCAAQAARAGRSSHRSHGGTGRRCRARRGQHIFEALLEGWKHDVRNLWWVIDYNRQSLDGVVNDRLFGRIGEMFELVGWRVVTLKYGKLLETAFAQPDGEHLRQWIDDCPNSLYSALVFKGGAGWREALTRDLNQYPGIRRILEQHADASLHRLMTNLAGNDMQAVVDAFEEVRDDTPTCFIAYTIKGQGLPFAGHKDNHSGLMTLEQMAGLQEGHGHFRRPGMGQVRRPHRAAGGVRSVPEGSAVQCRGPTPHRGAGDRDPGRAAQAERQGIEHADRLRQDPERDRGGGQRAQPPHRHDLARRLCFDQSRRLDQPARPVRPHRGRRRVPRAQGRVGPAVAQDAARPAHRARIAENNLFIQLAALGLSHELFAPACCRSARCTIRSSPAASMRLTTPATRTRGS
jgi:pyruvate dehydrogenase E1 component